MYLFFPNLHTLEDAERCALASEPRESHIWIKEVTAGFYTSPATFPSLPTCHTITPQWWPGLSTELWGTAADEIAIFFLDSSPWYSKILFLEFCPMRCTCQQDSRPPGKVLLYFISCCELQCLANWIRGSEIGKHSLHPLTCITSTSWNCLVFKLSDLSMMWCEDI